MKSLLGALLLSFLVPMALAQGTYTQIDVPGAIQTVPMGINNSGDVAGYYTDANVVYHGFLLSGGVFTTIDYPGTNFDFAQGINDVGQVVGNYSGATSAGFVYDIPSGTYTNISFPGSFDTYVDGINNEGTIVGQVYTSWSIPPVGFSLANGVFHKILPHGFDSAEVTGISNTNRAIGNAYHSSGGHVYFLFANKKLKTIQLPVASAFPWGINDLNALAGTYVDTATGSGAGFVYQGGVFQSLEFPGATSTVAWGVNNAGVVVGDFIDSGQMIHGYIWTPPSAAAKH